MARGSLRHLRRHTAPYFWPVHRKERVWVVKASPGPHPLSRSMPLAVVLRDVLGYALTLREARLVLAEGRVQVDGRVVRDYKFPVGLMDVLYLKGVEAYYRVLPHPSKYFMLHPIGEEEAHLKPLRVKRKTSVKGGGIQVTFHDGRNLQLSDGAVFGTYDTVLLDLRENKVLDHVRIEEGVLAYVIDGVNIGFLGRVESISKVFKRSKSVVTLRSGDRYTRTIMEYVFAVGRDRPLVSLPSEDEIAEWDRRFAKPRVLGFIAGEDF